jgi:hypothetical protein
MWFVTEVTKRHHCHEIERRQQVNERCKGGCPDVHNLTPCLGAFIIDITSDVNLALGEDCSSIEWMIDFNSLAGDRPFLILSASHMSCSSACATLISVQEKTP